MFKTFKKYTITPFITITGRYVERKHYTEPPVIIGGCGRSGTTLLLSILDAHPGICSIPEQTYAFLTWRFKGGTGIPAPHRIDRLYRRLLWRRVPAGTTRWCEKTPMNIRYFKQILDWYGPDVRLIHLVRDGRDVVTSRHPFKPDEYWVPYERWVNDVNAGLLYKDHPQVLTLEYENLVTGFDQALERICGFLNIAVTPEIRDWESRTSVRSSRHWHAPVHALTTAPIARWQLPEHAERIAGFMAYPGATDLLDKCGYGSTG